MVPMVPIHIFYFSFYKAKTLIKPSETRKKKVGT